jgi:predicted metal-dependent hydrolase
MSRASAAAAVGEELVVGDLQFEVRRSRRRHTVEITVDRGGELVLSAPADCPTSTMADFVRVKRSWIYTKLAEKEALRWQAPRKQFVSGEGFSYLGRSYRLLLVDYDQEVAVKLEHGRFKLRRRDAPRGREHMIRWYVAHARPWIEQHTRRYAARVGVAPGSVTVQDLGYRWGSCGKGDRLYFHWRAILLPPRIVEYIVVHELIHLHEAHHTPEFWRRLERAMSDFEQRKKWLAEHAGRIGL